jgi:hypothetical protein
LTAAEALRVCLERGVMVSGAAGFTAPGVKVPRALRIGMGGEVERLRVEEGLGIVAGVIGQWRERNSMKWRRWVSGWLLMIVGLLLVCSSGLYASAWYQRWRAEQLFAVIKSMTPGVTTEAEYSRAVGPLAGSSLQFGRLQPRTLYIAN